MTFTTKMIHFTRITLNQAGWFRMVVGGLFCLVLATVALAQPVIGVTPKSGPPTDKAAVSGTGFGSDEAVDIYFDTVDLALATTSPKGSFAGIRLEVPVSSPPGTHWVTGVGRRSGLAAQTGFVVETDWAQFHRGPRHLGDNRTENVLTTSTVGGLQLLWTQTVCDGSELAVAHGAVYAGGDAFHAITGKLLWSAPTVGCACGGCNSTAVSDGVAYVNSSILAIQALDVNNGQQLWNDSNLGVGLTATVSKGVVYVGQYEGGTYALDAATGAVLWTSNTGLGVQRAPAVVNGVVYVASYDWNLHALDAATGQQLWQTHTSGNLVDSPAVANGLVYAGAGNDLYAFNATTGQIVWTATTGGQIFSSPAVADGVVYLGSRDNKLYAFDAATGQPVWSTATGGSIFSSPAVANGVVYVGSDDSHVYAFDAASGAILWSAATQYTVDSSPVVANGMLYASSGPVLYAYGLPPVQPPSRPDPATLTPNLRLVSDH